MATFTSIVLTLALGAGSVVPGLKPVDLPPPPMPVFPALEAPAIDASSWKVYSATREAEIGSKNPDAQSAPASITKLLTAILVVENLSLDSQATVSTRAGSTPIGYVGQEDVRTGETWVVRDLLSLIMVGSGNVASATLGEAVSGSPEAFAVLMNQKAQAIGMANSHFVNAHGLDAEGQVSTANDLIALGREALLHPDVLATTRIKSIPFRLAPREFTVDSTNRLLGVFPGYLGLKTGDTVSAGQVLLSYTETQHDRVLAVVLGSKGRRVATRELVAWAMTTMGPRDHFFAPVVGTELALLLPEWYLPRLAAAGGLDGGEPTAPDRTPLTDDLNARFREMLPVLLGGDP